MLRHPSLDASFVAPPDLDPWPVMAPASLCWCESGRPWSACHAIRESETPLRPHALVAKHKGLMAQAYCSHPKAGPSHCSGKAIKAHTVQKRSGLAAIQERGHVLTSLEILPDLIMGKEGDFSRIGVNAASTFKGFCARHDASLFRKIEHGDVRLDRESGFLHAYRAIAREAYNKRNSVDVVKMQKRVLDRGLPYAEQVAIQSRVHLHMCGTMRGLAEIEAAKAEFDKALLSGDFGRFHYVAVQFDGLLPIVACGGFYPEATFSGEPLQKLSRGNAPLDLMTVNCTALDGRALVVLGWHGEVDGPCGQLANSLLALSPRVVAAAVIRLLFEYVENIYLRESWWRSLNAGARRSLFRRLPSGTGIVARRWTALLEDGADYEVASKPWQTSTNLPSSVAA